MIRELRQVGSIHDAPIVLVILDLGSKDWVGLAYKNSLDFLSICFWSTRDDTRMQTGQLLDELASDVAIALDADPADKAPEALFDIKLKQPAGWDRWLGGIPGPMRSFFDDALHPRLRALLKTQR